MGLILHELYGRAGRTIVTAHRGFSWDYPENTVPAFLAAVEAGADIIEFDVQATSDDVPIVLHDPTLDRTTDGGGPPGNCTLSELKRFEASFWQGARESGRRLDRPAMPGTRIPTLEETLECAADRVGLNIQVKDTSPALLAEICRLYRRYDLYERGYLTMPTFEAAGRVRRLDRDAALCVTGDRANLEAQAAFGCLYAQPLRSHVTPAFCRAARDLGLHANMFYSNTDEDNRRYIAMGIAGILTDRPDVLLRTLQQTG